MPVEITPLIAGAPTYPTTIDTDSTLGPTSAIVAGTTTLAAGDQLGITKNAINTIIALETVAGITNSTVTTSHEYRIRRLPWRSWVAGLEFNPPASNYAVFAAQANGTPYLSFATGTGAVFIGMIPWGQVFSASGVVVRLRWSSHAAITGNCNWGAAFERFGTAAITSDHFGTQVTSALTVGGTIDIEGETPITIPYSGMGSAVAGDTFRLQIQRLVTSDTLSGAAQLTRVSIENAT